MKSVTLLSTIALALQLFLPARLTAEDNPLKILEDSDLARGGLGHGYNWKVKLESSDEDGESSFLYLVKSKGNNAHVSVLEPARSKGEVMLFNDRTIWFFKKTLSKPVAISARQKLSGQAVNGDIASTNYARDYIGKIIGEEDVDGKACYVLDLKSKSDKSTYDGIKYWVSKKKRLGLKAEFLSLEGKPLRVATFKYGNKLKISGKSIDFVSEVKIIDAQNPKSFSVMTYTSPKIDTPPDSLFNVNNLLR
jgi:outer membrane lipoprotein-sorting protein